MVKSNLKEIIFLKINTIESGGHTHGYYTISLNVQRFLILCIKQSL